MAKPIPTVVGTEGVDVGTERNTPLETALRESEERFRLLVARVTDYAIFMLDANGRIASWNEGARRIKGYEAEEILGQHFSVFYTREDIERSHPAEDLRLAVRDGSFEEEGWRVRKDGTRFWASVSITALREDGGNPRGFVKVTRDMTERKRTETKLRESEERFRLLVERVEDYAIFMLDPDGNVATWNAGAERIKGYVADEIIGWHFSAFYPLGDVERGKPDLELEIAKVEGKYAGRARRLPRHRRPPGRPPLSAVFRPDTPERKRPAGPACVSTSDRNPPLPYPRACPRVEPGDSGLAAGVLWENSNARGVRVDAVRGWRTRRRDRAGKAWCSKDHSKG